MRKKIALTCAPTTALAIFLCLSTLSAADEELAPTVGTSGRVEQVFLPGSELQARPLDSDRLPMVVRIVDVFPHGDGFRYDISFYGLEPGKYNLAEYLVRKDGSAANDLPPIPVEVISLLPPGQVEPNQLETGMISRLGGYTVLMIVAITLWVIILAGLILLGRRKKQRAAAAKQPLTLADLLQPRIQQAIDDELDPAQYAELERMLFAFWRRRLNLEDLSSANAIHQIREDEQAGPLMNQLEQWMHNPNRDNQLDLPTLLKPLQNLVVDQHEHEHFTTSSSGQAEAVRA